MSESVSREKFSQVDSYAVFRESPRPCINQELVDRLNIIKKARFLVHGTQEHEAISYARAISVIIGCPYKIKSLEQALALIKVGPKIGHKIQEFLTTGRIAQADQDAANPKYAALEHLSSIHGIAWKTAIGIYEEELAARGGRPVDTQVMMDRLRRDPNYQGAFKYHDDLQLKMTRADVQDIAGFVSLQLERVEPGFHMEITGSYRRGKEDSSDVDLLITYPHEVGKEGGVLSDLIHRLKVKGLVPQEDGVLSLCTDLSKGKANGLDWAHLIFVHKADDGTSRPRDIHRRLDIVVAPWTHFGAALVGWTGSTQFERDLRAWADKGMHYKFDSHALMDEHGRAIPTNSERDVFRALGIPWIPPELRNADP